MPAISQPMIMEEAKLHGETRGNTDAGKNSEENKPWDVSTDKILESNVNIIVVGWLVDFGMLKIMPTGGSGK